MGVLERLAAAVGVLEWLAAALRRRWRWRGEGAVEERMTWE
jgi:hypothetical protein